MGAFESTEDIFVWFDQPVASSWDPGLGTVIQPQGELSDADPDFAGRLANMIRAKTFSFSYQGGPESSTSSTTSGGDGGGSNALSRLRDKFTLELGKGAKTDPQKIRQLGAEIRRVEEQLAQRGREQVQQRQQESQQRQQQQKAAASKGKGKDDTRREEANTLGTCSITKPVDRSSSALMTICVRGACLPNVQVICRKAGGDQIIFLEYCLRRVFIKSMAWASSEAVVNETVQFSFIALGMRYFGQAPSGSKGYYAREVAWHNRLRLPTLADECGPVADYFTDSEMAD